MLEFYKDEKSSEYKYEDDIGRYFYKEKISIGIVRSPKWISENFEIAMSRDIWVRERLFTECPRR